jgi:hypothetical protein
MQTPTFTLTCVPARRSQGMSCATNAISRDFSLFVTPRFLKNAQQILKNAQQNLQDLSREGEVV